MKIDKPKQHKWHEDEIEYLLDCWQIGYTANEVADLLTLKFPHRMFTNKQVLGMIKNLRTKFGDENVDGNRRRK